MDDFSYLSILKPLNKTVKQFVHTQKRREKKKREEKMKKEITLQ